MPANSYSTYALIAEASKTEKVNGNLMTKLIGCTELGDLLQLNTVFL